ncbi:hypothetical protein BD311DRAFT_792709 [Dichomitus squalens]|uniref:Anamorsin C-terminal domain-containing protein n=1 Tax=Dichomitus squalens TaxID=114155 RepID=A0A4V2JYK2_9APHY|nr:hypothetical protein BD311DRAFT_792709 [Dichomitus squalens]
MREVGRHLVDRFLDGATTLPLSKFASVHVSLPTPEYKNFVPRTPDLLPHLLKGLKPLGTLHLLNFGASLPTLPSNLIPTGFTVLSTKQKGTFIALKPAHTTEASTFLRTTPVAALSLWRKADPEKASKKVPAAYEPAAYGVQNCACGLAELELAQSKVVLLDGKIDGQVDGKVDGQAIEVSQAEKERLMAAAAATPRGTSSCGDCYLGDTFWWLSGPIWMKTSLSLLVNA